VVGFVVLVDLDTFGVRGGCVSVGGGGLGVQGAERAREDVG
jgi:hypothetical protein